MTTCEKCGKPLEMGEYPFCGGRNNHGFPIGGGLTIIGDEWQGGGSRTFENIDSVPRTFENKSQWKRFMAERGLVNRVEHKPMPGSDRSPHTQRFV